MSDRWMTWAERVDAFRVVPRLLVTLYGAYCLHVGAWFMVLPDPSGSQAAFVSTVWGAAAAWFGLYVKTGRSWAS